MKELLDMLQMQNVTKIFSNKPVLRNLSMTVAPGEIVAFLGPNGAGKSTAFKCIVGLMKPTNGKILVNGETAKQNPIKYKQQIGYLGHESFLYEAFSPIENLTFYGKLYRTSNLEETVISLLKKVGLYRFRDIRIDSFSRGMMQRLAIARMLLSEPDILLLDEPHTGLDQGAITLLNEIVKEKQAEGKAIILISHDFEQVLTLCDRAVVLSRGKIAAETKITDQSLLTLRNWYAEAVDAR